MKPTSQPPQNPGDELIDFHRIYHLVLTKLWLIAAITAVLVILVGAIVLQLPKLYTARAVIQVEQNEANVGAMKDVTEEDLQSKDFIGTVMQALVSRPVVLRVINSLGLADQPTFGPPKKGDKPRTADSLVPYLTANIEVEQRKGTRIVDISVDDTEPERARDMARAMVQEFFRESIQQRLALSRVTNEFLREESEKLKAKLEDSERKLQEYREKHNAVSLEDRQNIIVEKLRELNTNATEAKSQRLKLEADLEQIQKIDPANVEQMLAIGSVASLPQVASIRDQLVTADAELAALTERYLPKHPKYIATRTKIENLRESLKNSTLKAGEILNQKYAASKQNEAKADEALKDQEKLAMELNQTAIPYGVLQREVESDRALYDSVIKRLRETSFLAGAEQTPFRILEDPIVPNSPSKPRVLLILFITAFMGLILSTGGVIVWDMINTSLRSVDEAESFLGLAALAAVPDLQRQRQRVMEELKESISKKRLPDHEILLARKKWQDEHPIVLITAPNSPPAEAFRTFRASVALLGPEKDRRSFLFTSAIPAEGKSFTSLNSAVAFAQMGLKTVIVDADLRRPKLHTDLLGVDSSPLGLTDVLSEHATIEKVVQKTQVENLFVIPAGSRSPNPAELLSNTDFPAVLEKLLSMYDRVVIDTAPINAVSDTLLICGCAQCVVLVVRAGGPPRKAVKRAIQLLAKANARFGGFVINRLPAGTGSGYYYYYYGGDYSKEGVYGSENLPKETTR